MRSVVFVIIVLAVLPQVAFSSGCRAGEISYIEGDERICVSMYAPRGIKSTFVIITFVDNVLRISAYGVREDSENVTIVRVTITPVQVSGGVVVEKSGDIAREIVLHPRMRVDMNVTINVSPEINGVVYRLEVYDRGQRGELVLVERSGLIFVPRIRTVDVSFPRWFGGDRLVAVDNALGLIQSILILLLPISSALGLMTVGRFKEGGLMLVLSGASITLLSTMFSQLTISFGGNPVVYRSIGVFLVFIGLTLLLIARQALDRGSALT